MEAAVHHDSAAIDELADADGDLVVEDFEAWPGANGLGEYSSAGALANGDGAGAVVDGALRLEYDDGGWFLSNVRSDLSGYTHLELNVRGDDGGEETDVHLEIGAVEAPLAELTDDAIETEFSTVRVDLSAAGVDPSAVQDVWLTFWDAGSGAIELDEVRFVDGGSDGETIEIGNYRAQDPDGDGLYTDITGSGETTHEDVAAFFEHLESDAVQNNPDAFDFADDGRVGFADVVELLRQV